MKKRLFAGFLALIMLLGLLPMSALAARIGEGELPLAAPAGGGGDVSAPIWVDAADADAQQASVDPADLVNIASEATLAHSPEVTGQWLTEIDDINNLVNGDYNDQFRWIHGGVRDYITSKGVEPSVTLTFAENRAVGAVKVGFLKKDSESSHNYAYRILGKASGETEYRELASGTASKASNNCVKTHALTEITQLSSIQLVFTNESDDVWPILAEIEVLAQRPPVDLTTLTNLAKGAGTDVVTYANVGAISDPLANLTDEDPATEFQFYGGAIPDGATTSCWLQFDLGSNHSIGGFEFDVKASTDTHGYQYDIYGRANGAAEDQWVKYVSNVAISHTAGENTQQHALTAMTDLRYIKFVLHDPWGGAWPAIGDIKIFGEAQETPDDPYQGLVEVAGRSEITVPSNDANVGLITDGSVATQWAAASGTWPANIDFALPGNLLIQRIELDFERYNGRTFDLTVSKAVNNVTSDYTQLAVKDGHDVNGTYVLDLSTPQRMTHVRVALRGTNGQAWPALAEARIYAVDETIDLNNYDDITSHADETAGTGYKEWDFHSNQQVVGFRTTLTAGSAAVVKGKMKRDTGWTTYVAQLQNGDNVLSFPAGMSAVRVELDDTDRLVSFQIFGAYTAGAVDTGSVAFDKPTHGNFNAATTYQVNDGDKNTAWQPDMYPAYVDIDLEGNYDISQLQVFTAEAGYTEYTLYTSMDGQNFDLVASKLNDDPCPADGDKHTLTAPKTARYIRVYLEYYSNAVKPALREVRAIGALSANQTDQTVTFQDVTPFDRTDYAAAITQTDTINEVKGIIERQINQRNPNSVDYRDWFTFVIGAADPDGYDYFTLENADGKIRITGNDGVSLATGLNHYLKYYCNVHISQVGCQVNMPAAVVPVPAAGVHKETQYPVRYAYNYCTLSYTMSFWGEDEWRNELDWLALNGVNVVLDPTGQEEVWREFLMSPQIGYTHQEAKDFLAGPGYYAWAYMANLTGFGGPIHDSFLTERVELARKNQRSMRALGMEPVFQAFSGMVPVDITTHDPDAQVIAQGKWCSFQRPTMLKTDTATYDEYARLFYAAQKRVLGDAKYFATDPFHEGGNTGGMATNVVSRELMDSLLEFAPDAVWVIQSWQGNPSNGLLQGLREGGASHTEDLRAHALILDLYAERTPHNNEAGNGYGVDTDGDGVKEFSDTPWVWCMLNNFGGRMGLHGYLDNLHTNIPAHANRSKHMAGVGMAPEGAQENPLLYDFLFETIWTADASQDLPEIDLDQWLADYARRRYGGDSAKARQALTILAETAYNGSLKTNVGQGAPESVVNARPAKSIGAASTWGYSNISYDKTELQKAAQLLLDEYDSLSASDAYLYDLADFLKQVLSNTAQKIHGDMVAAYNARNVSEFNILSDKFLELIDLSDDIMSTRKEFLFGTWTTNASEMAQNADDFTQRLYLRNAKALVTTWGSIEQCNSGGLKDYSNRQWSGLTKDYYKARWQTWIDQAKANLAAGNSNNISIDWFPWEWSYARDTKTYSNVPSALSLKTLGQRVMADFTLVTPPEEMDDYDLPATAAKAGSQETSSEQSPASNVLDGNTGTIWHTQYSSPAATRDQMWIALDLGYARMVDGLRYLPRQGNVNGRITGYEIYVSSSDTDWAGTTNTWTKVAQGTWASTTDWKKASFTAVSARYVKLVATASEGDFASAAEIRVTNTPIAVESVALDRTAATLYVTDSDPTLTLTATVAPANATNKAVTWSTDNSAVATVNNGVVTAVGVGSATITVTTEDGAKTASCAVTVKGRMSGQVHITGTPKFGSTLTASLNQIAPAGAKDHPVYQWYRDGAPISGATNAAYTVAAADIGHAITVKVTASDPYEGQSTSEAVTGAKADGPAMLATPTYRNASASDASDGAITGLFKGRHYQYLLWDFAHGQPGENADWKDADFSNESEPTPPVAGQVHGTAEITGLAPGNYVVRRAGDDTHAPGPISNTVTIAVEGVENFKLTNPHDFNGGVVQARRSQIPAQDTVRLVVTPNQGYQLEAGSLRVTHDSDPTQVILPAESQTEPGVYTFTMPAANVTISARFTRLTHTLEHQLTNISCSMIQHDHTVLHGEAPVIDLTPNPGYDLPETITITRKSDGSAFFGYTYRGGRIEFTQGVTEDLVIAGQGVQRTYIVDYTALAHLTADGQPSTIKHGQTLSVTLTPAEGYRLPKLVSVTVGGAELRQEDFTYSAADGRLTIPSAKVTGNVFIIAVGTPVAGFTITYDLAGGTLAEENPTVYTSSTPAFTLHNPTRPGFTFAGWTGSGLVQPTVTVTIPQGSTGNRSYTATWSSSSGGSGGGGGGSAKPAVPETPAVTNPDGSVTTTVVKPDGTKTETTKAPDGTVAVVETKPDGSKTQTVKQADGTKSELAVTKDGAVTVTVTDGKGEALVKTQLPASVPAPETKFQDLADAPWAEEAINKVAALELVKGTGDNKYDPVSPMTRGALATVLHRLSQGKTNYQSSFKDVAQGQYYTEGVAWAARAGVVTGISADVFAPDRVITREQLAVMLARYAKLIGLNTAADAKTLDRFADGKTTGSWAVDGVAWCVEKGILKGKGQDGLDPASNVTRAEVAVMLDRFLALLK